MKYTVLCTTLAFGLMSAQFAQGETFAQAETQVQTPAPTQTQATPQSAPETVTPVEVPPPEGSAAEAAQLQREHLRAVAAGDQANDPHDSSSSDALNRRELAKAEALGNGPVYTDSSAVSNGREAVPAEDATKHDPVL